MAMAKDRLEDQGKDVFRVNVSTHLSWKGEQRILADSTTGKTQTKKRKEKKKENEPNTSKATLEKRKALEGDSCTCYTRVPVDYFQPAR